MVSERQTVLVVDDSEADQFLSKRVIQKFDPTIEILQARDGREALEALDGLAHPPVAVILDINMPVMNGLEFLAEYEQRGSLAALVVILTSSTVARDKEKAQKFTCDVEYLTKPMSLESLTSVLCPTTQSATTQKPSTG